jgi:hypothetical protein
MCWIRSINGENKKYMANFDWESLVKQPLGRQRRKCEDNIKTDAKKRGCEGEGRMGLA